MPIAAGGVKSGGPTPRTTPCDSTPRLCAPVRRFRGNRFFFTSILDTCINGLSLTISQYLDMQILTTPQQLAAQCRAWHKAGDDIALVPTMGYYLSLIHI